MKDTRDNKDSGSAQSTFHINIDPQIQLSHLRMNTTQEKRISFHHQRCRNTVAVRYKSAPAADSSSRLGRFAQFGGTRGLRRNFDWIIRLGDGFGAEAETFAPLADFVGSESSHGREELTLDRRVPLLWLCFWFWFGLCFCFSCILTRIVACDLWDGDSTRQNPVRLRIAGVVEMVLITYIVFVNPVTSVVVDGRCKYS